jgi:gluconate 2-dehydrogenase gamma chain
MSSGDSNTSRRNFLVGAIALAPAAAGVAGQASAEAPKSDDPQDSTPAANHPAVSDYRLAFFTSAEWAFINAACARLTTADEHGPGAVELGVPQFIDRQMGTPCYSVWGIAKCKRFEPSVVSTLERHHDRTVVGELSDILR